MFYRKHIASDRNNFSNTDNNLGGVAKKPPSGSFFVFTNTSLSNDVYYLPQGTRKHQAS